MILEFSQYLENYLWPNYLSTNASFAHMMSIVIMLNEKFRERVAPWQVDNYLYIYKNIHILTYWNSYTYFKL